MRIALLTIWHIGNYGAELQAYATYKILQQLGHDVIIIDLREDQSSNESLKTKIARFISKFTLANYKFERFWRKYLPNKTIYYKNIEQLKNTPPQADMYLVGSDQVWNYDITKEKAEVYFLNFGSNNIKRVSFASSFGKNQWNAPSYITEIAQRMFPQFSKISCRETSGLDILKNTFNIEANIVIDPTLLFRGYPEFTGNNIKQRQTLVYYPLSDNEKLCQFSRKIANELGLKPINSNKKIKLTNTIAWNRNSIEKWIRDIAQASFVITPSFHGLAFSLIYKKQFIIINNNINQQRKTRMIDLLERLNLSDRFFESEEDAEIAKPWLKPIDYSKVTPILEQYREESITYLKKISEL